MENPIQMDDLGVPPFSDTPIVVSWLTRSQMSQTKPPKASAAAHSIMRLSADRRCESWHSLVMSFSTGKKKRSLFGGFHGDNKLEDLFKPGQITYI